MLLLKNKFCLFLLAFFGFCHLSAQNQFTDKTNQKIWEAKDRSDVFYTLEILTKGKAAHKILALKGLQSWHDTSFYKPLQKLIKRGNKAVRIAALEAVGQSRDSNYIPALLKIINKRGGKRVKPYALVALGKCITKSKVNLLLELKNPEQKGYAECMYRAMLKGVGDKELTNRLINSMGLDNETNLYIVWYLSRTQYPITSNSFYQFDIKTQKPYIKGEPTDVMIGIIQAFGKSKLNQNDSSSKNPIERPLRQTAAGSYNSDKYVNLVAVYRAMGASKFYYDSILFKNIRTYIGNGFPPLQLAYSELISKNCKAFEKNPQLTYAPAIVNLLKLNDCNYTNLKLPVTNTIYDKIWSLQLLESNYQNYAAINTILMQTEEPAVKSAAMESLIKCRMVKGFPENLISDFNESVSILIKDGDEGAVSIIANAILDNQIPLEPNYEQLFIETQKKLNLPQDMEAYIDIEKVLAKIHNTTYIKPEAEWNHPINWEFVSQIKADEKIKVSTTQGTFIIQMNVNEAPGSVSSILKLVDDGFYNGKYFHRMVPNFVVQGGCPRGDGFGSQNYTIRSEFSSLKYKTGAVGLASAGSNTESCQWFVTHCPAPHLDGRYTIIGYVVEGMEVIHKLGVGDKMLKVERLK